MNRVNYLLLSDSRDFTTDYVAFGLNKRKQSYLRLDRDLLARYEIAWNVNNNYIHVHNGAQEYYIDEDNLRGVYYRAPTYLRETFTADKPPEKQLEQSQWMSFFRNLVQFDRAQWINSPSATFHAENKLVQLKTAKKLGLRIPTTIVTNHHQNLPDFPDFIVKSIDTALLKFENEEAFVYSNIVDKLELSNANLAIAPVIIQQHLYPKIDYRVTVVRDDLFCAKILVGDAGVRGDWRRHKDSVEFIDCKLPADVEASCYQIVKALGLNYGGIDLALHNGEFFFIELNPTGEWAWLVNSAKQRIDEAIS